MFGGRRRRGGTGGGSRPRRGPLAGSWLPGSRKDRNLREVGEGAQGFVYEGVGDEVVLEEIARDEEGVHGAVAGMGKRGTESLQALGAQTFSFRAEPGRNARRAASRRSG